MGKLGADLGADWMAVRSSAGHGYTYVAGVDTRIPLAVKKSELQEEMNASHLLYLIYVNIQWSMMANDDQRDCCWLTMVDNEQ